MSPTGEGHSMSPMGEEYSMGPTGEHSISSTGEKLDGKGVFDEPDERLSLDGRGSQWARA